ncbi:hypothetical protein [Methylotenera sp.]|uniref:hypothetical protein n=1 Tax=Methylotenera sp. TaxID=2051956 RepID=UPI00248975E2|nr:hypothetical protein [Methylotenera sp.]MDI1299658.1 hypothetical protein [Methylotenera sp.]
MNKTSAKITFMTSKKIHQGFLLPAAIFILVILAGLGAYALNITSIQQVTSTQDVQGTRAYQSARAGVEWGAYQILQTSPDNTTILACFTSPSVLSLDGFTVTVRCTKYGDYNEQNSDHTIAVYQITSTATFGTVNTSNYIERQIQLNLSKCRGTDASSAYICS